MKPSIKLNAAAVVNIANDFPKIAVRKKVIGIRKMTATNISLRVRRFIAEKS